MILPTPALVLLPISLGCIGTRNIEPDWLNADGSAQDGPSDGDAVEVQSGCEDDEVNTTDGFRIAGTVHDVYADDLPADPDALCAYALDPLPVLSGQPPIVMAASKVCPNGDYVIGELYDPPTIGMFVSIDDCEGNEDTVMSSATGIDFDDVKNLGDGDLLSNQRAYLVTNEYGSLIDANLDGYDGDAVSLGFMTGFATDVSDQPVDGARLSCGGCTTFYYMDNDDSDGLFSTGGSMNTATSVEAEAVFVAPEAPIATYAAEDGGNHTWDDQLFGSLPGYASFLLFNAQ